MTRLIYEKKIVQLPTKLLLGLALLLLAPFAIAQNTLGELLDAGAKKVSPEEFREQVVQRATSGTLPSGTHMELTYTSGGMIQGRGDTGGLANPGGPVTSMGSVDGVWNVDDRGRICTSLVFGRVFLPLRCEYWFKYKDAYFLAVSDSDPKAKVLRRTVKQ
jgi:hypothetical protein